MPTLPVDFVDQLYEFIHSVYRPGGLTAAAIGMMWKLRNPTLPWTRHGFDKLGDALEAVVARYADLDLLNRHTPQLRLIRRGDNCTEPPRNQTHFHTRPVPKAIWSAFITEPRPGTKRYFNRATGRVLFDTDESPTPAAEWVEIQSIPQDEQREWARAFLNEHSLGDDDGVIRSLEGAGWFLSFTDTLSTKHPHLLPGWNRAKSVNVTAAINAWRQANAVDALEEAPPRNLRAFPAGPAIAEIPDREDSDLRRALLEVFSHLHTHELLALCVPLHATLRAVRPDLLK